MLDYCRLSDWWRWCPSPWGMSTGNIPLCSQWGSQICARGFCDGAPDYEFDDHIISGEACENIARDIFEDVTMDICDKPRVKWVETTEPAHASGEGGEIDEEVQHVWDLVILQIHRLKLNGTKRKRVNVSLNAIYVVDVCSTSMISKSWWSSTSTTTAGRWLFCLPTFIFRYFMYKKGWKSLGWRIRLVGGALYKSELPEDCQKRFLRIVV